MSQTKVFTCTDSTTVRALDDGSLGQGDGGSKRLYVGRRGSSGSRRNYDSYLKFALDWSGVRTIKSAVLTLTTDDALGGLFIAAGLKDTPKITVRRLTDSFTEGNNADGDFDSSDFTSAAGSSSGAVTKSMSKVLNGQTDIDITTIVRAWAPSTVQGGGKQSNFGIGLFGTTSFSEEWAGWSRHALAQYRPFITLTYELGATTPDVPSNMSPVGAVAAVGAFQGDFTDIRPTDTLARTTVQVYESSAIKSGTASTDDLIHVANHGYSNGQLIWFTSLTGGVGLSTAIPYYVRNKTTSTFKVSATPTSGLENISTAYSALSVGSPLWTLDKAASNTETVNDRFNVIPTGLHLRVNTSYKWRAKVRDQEAQWSSWSGLVVFSVSNTDPDAPTLSPDGLSYDSLNGVLFRGGDFSDPDAGDSLLAYQVQLSAQPEGDPDWDDASFLLWDTGKRYVASGSTDWETPYGGTDLLAGTYYWRARQWDNHDGVSDWAYASIILTTDFDADPGTQTSIQIDPHAPWRIRIREMKMNALSIGAITGVASTNLITSGSAHGLKAGWKVHFSALTGGTGLFTDTDYWVIASGLTTTAFKVAAEFGGTEVNFTTNITAATLTTVTTRGPGNTIAVLENAKSVGASIVYNSPGELHFTLPVDHPQIAVIEPWQVHYGVDFYGGDGWRETFAGLVWNFDATETSVVFLGLDYLSLADLVLDERYDPSAPDKSAANGGSKYVNQRIDSVVTDQLTYIRGLTDSPVAFIGIGAIATMTERVTIWSTAQPTLSFIAGLLDSHRQGTGKRTRIEVKRTTGGSYQFVVTDDPGQVRDNLRLAYGELVQGYRVIPFSTEWASRVNSVGRTREGLRVLYKNASAPGIDQHTYGRIARTLLIENIADEADMTRRTQQAALHAGKLGKDIALSVRIGVLQPRDGYDICDVLPVRIVHGAVDTTRFGSGYWTVMGLAWEGQDDGHSETTLTLFPREDTVSPDPDLIPSAPISPQAEWQVGWQAPILPTTIPLALDTGLLMDDDWLMDGSRVLVTGRVYFDAATGNIYELNDDGVTWTQIAGPPTLQAPSGMIVTTRPTLNEDGTAVVNISVSVTP